MCASHDLFTIQCKQDSDTVHRNRVWCAVSMSEHTSMVFWRGKQQMRCIYLHGMQMEPCKDGIECLADVIHSRCTRWLNVPCPFGVGFLSWQQNVICIHPVFLSQWNEQEENRETVLDRNGWCYLSVWWWWNIASNLFTNTACPCVGMHSFTAT